MTVRCRSSVTRLRRGAIAVGVAVLILATAAGDASTTRLTSSRVKVRNVTAAYGGGTVTWGLAAVLVGRKPLSVCRATARITLTPNGASIELATSTWIFNACKGNRSWKGAVPAELQRGDDYILTGEISQSSGTSLAKSQTGLILHVP